MIGRDRFLARPIVNHPAGLDRLGSFRVDGSCVKGYRWGEHRPKRHPQPNPGFRPRASRVVFPATGGMSY
jgi:hypothetical protein